MFRDIPMAPKAAAVGALALLAAVAVPLTADLGLNGVGKAWAAGHGEGKQGDDSGHGDDGKGKEDKGEPQRKGVDLKGLEDGVGGGRPVWAKEGIPEVELGRLSVVRSPDQVFERAYLEALNTLTPEMIEFYSLPYRDMLYELSVNFDDLSFIDSPLQNLALLEELLANGESILTSPEIGVDNTTGVLAAVFLGVASDKTIPVTVDTVVAVTTILGTPITGTLAEQLAEAAEAIRIAILAGHG